MCLYWLWWDPTPGWSFSLPLQNEKSTFLGPWRTNEMSCVACLPHCHGLHLASDILVFPPWPPTFSCLETCFQLRLATSYVLCDTFWQIQFDFTLEVFLDLILLLWKVIKRVVLFKGRIVSHLLMGLLLFFLKMSIHLYGTIHGVSGICCKQRHWSLTYSSQWTTQRVKVKSLALTLIFQPLLLQGGFLAPSSDWPHRVLWVRYNLFAIRNSHFHSDNK